MNFVEKRDIRRPENEEAPFALGENFFSRTDERGIIQSGNYIFKRVAHFDWDELLGAPHKIIRHSDMPKAVFWLLWDTIKKGQPIGAYVKNKTKDGLLYWVYAVVVPVEDGYLSVRIKPTSALLDVIKKEYATLREVELTDSISSAESAALLLARIGELGFADYSEFASHSLSEELIARDIGLENRADRNIAAYQKMLSLAELLKTETSALMHEFQTMKIVPSNMRIIASQVESAGGTIGTLSQNYGSISEEIFDWLDKHVAGPDSDFSAIRGSIEDSMFLQCASRILKEVAEEFAHERRDLGGINISIEQAKLNDLAGQYVAKAADGLKRVGDVSELISDAAKKLQRHVLGLSTMQVMLKIESARLPDGGTRLDGVIEQLNGFQNAVKDQLKQINGHSDHISVLVGSLQSNQSPSSGFASR